MSDARSAPASDAPTRLSRRLGLADAVFLGLGSMIGAGISAGVAWLNAVSVAQLARFHPESGGAYVYGRARLSPATGFLAGWAFVSGKIASCAAMALTFGSYALPDAPAAARALSVLAVVALTGVNVLGVERTARTTRAIVIGVVATLLVTTAAIFAAGRLEARRLVPDAIDPWGCLQGAAFLFFAFAGYARIATLGEEVRRPERTIPAAISLALALTVVLYAVVIVATVSALEPAVLVASAAPLVAAVEAAELPMLAPLVRAGAALACLGVLLSLLAGVSRTVFAMSANRDLPGWLGAVHRDRRVPHRAEAAVGTVIAIGVALVDVRTAIGFSSFNVLVYYGIANAAAWTLSETERTRPRALAALGLVACGTIAATLPWTAVGTGVAVLLGGTAARAPFRGRTAR
jgi:APA family basic amino acid/polyamine antiporter